LPAVASINPGAPRAATRSQLAAAEATLASASPASSPASGPAKNWAMIATNRPAASASQEA
jgi:hypothetical protein